MQLSLQNLLDWLVRHDYSVSGISIEDDGPTLKGVRLLQNYLPEGDGRDIAYIGPSMEFINPVVSGTFICCKSNIIYLDSADSELIFNECLTAFEFFNRWEMDLLEAVIQNRPLDEFVRIGHGAFQSPMFISGTNGESYAITSQYDPSIHPVWRQRLQNRNLSFEYINQFHESEYFSEMYASRYPQIAVSPIWGGQILFSNLRYRGERVGSIIIYEYKHKFYEGDTHLLNFYTMIVEKAMALNPGKYFFHSDREVMLHNLLENKDVDWQSVYAVLKRNKWKEEHRFAVLCACSPSGIDNVVIGRLREILSQRYPGLISILYESCLVILINVSLERDINELTDEILALMHQKLRIGSSYSFSGLEHLPFFYRQAQTAMQEAQRLKTTNISFQEIYSDALSRELRTNDYLRSFVHPDIRALARCDKEQNTNYLDTLREFILCGESYSEAAARLFLHRNTLIYRINKIKSMLSMELEDERARSIYLASISLYRVFL